MPKKKNSGQLAADSRRKRDSLIATGQLMSNILYNLAQSAELPEGWRNTAKSTYEQWDKIRRGE